MRNLFAKFMLFVAAVGILAMFVALISIGIAPGEVRDGVATYTQGIETTRSSVWMLVVGITTVALAGVLWVLVRPHSRRELAGSR